MTLSPHVVRLRPAPHTRTPILSYSLKVEPADQFLNWQQDAYSNYAARLVFPRPTREFRVTVDLVAEMVTINPFDFFIEESAEKYPFAYDPVLAHELVPYLHAVPAGPKLTDLVAACRTSGVPINDFLVETNRRVQRAVKYLIRLEPGVQTPEETLQTGSGSCRDSAWLLVQVFRHLGLAARFCSGYLIQLTADEPSLDGPSGPAADFTDLHAWTEVYLPGAGWVGLDPTSGLLAGEGHIPLACSADPISAAPITGSVGWHKLPGEGDDAKLGEEFRFEMSVTRVHESPRVTKPYSADQWDAIAGMGRAVDADLREWDVRLTMGGEPTFVSIDHRDAAEWNTAALGDHKKMLAGDLLKRLRRRFAPGGLPHFGQGKWYPGEQLPRWAYTCYWRRDDVPLWLDESLIGDPHESYGHTADLGGRFISRLAELLDVNPAHAIPGYEDAWYYLWRERTLPANVDPLASNLSDPQERERIARLFDRGLNAVVGHVLPLRRASRGGVAAWQSGAWFLRREHLFLIPGDSAMGYRLPLDSLPWESADVRQRVTDPDPMAPKPPLLGRPQFRGTTGDGQRDGYPAPGANGRPAPAYDPTVVRTALCVEPREGRLHVFMPPVYRLDDYLELVAAVEQAAAELGAPVMLEGYKPPSDHRINHFAVTPDPGVIEVNLHPAHSWDELTHNTEVLYDEAKRCRLTADKFMLDGRHSGTGGGNHVILGGATPADSPLLRRPDLLKSLLSCWHNHPSLSYLFSSLFVGPTSQAPRVDEARHDSLYELEVAFGQIPAPGGGHVPPWLVDRAFRHLLTDVTGNTHRAEFCIDKLFSPDTPDGRRGLLELRAFEMPPHPHMSLVQQLLLRALVARFWKKPYPHPLVRWGTELHDRFVLPHFVERDFADLLTEMRQAGFPLAADWFAPHHEFRFPTAGEWAADGVHVELRSAIEPWHVLGEETAAGGTARYVDSSVERMQVKVRGMTDPRHVLTCNGRRVPLHPTGTNGEFVAGVRYRAWQPPSCLHPTIPVHAPLTFDLYDMWTERSLGGCRYHVSHPGGRSYDTFPVNANEAEGRRISRFFTHGHTQGTWTPPPVEVNPEAPLTLDLRRPVASPPEGRKTVPAPAQRAAVRVGV